MSNTAILLVNCRDKKGLVAGITNFIFKHNGNIINLDQYTNCAEKKFFMRIEWEMKGFSLSKDKLKNELPPLANKLGINYQLFFSDQKLNMGILVSKYDHCLFDLLLRKRSGELDINIPVIISNHPDLKEVADMFKIEFYHLPIKGSKNSQEKQILKILQEKNIDFVTLARYMQILSGSFVKKYKNSIINVHHSFLPAFSGAKPYHQAHKKGVKVIGATSHFVTVDLDAGPIIEQETIKISHKDNVDDLVRKGRDLERKVLAQAVQLFIQHRLFIDNQRTIIL